MTTDEMSSAIAEGYRMAVRDMTHLTTQLNDRRTLEALKRFLYVMEALAEDERPSVYWHTEEEVGA